MNKSSRTSQPTQHETNVKRGWKRMVHLLLAASTFALGVCGMFLPVLPTTPFLLLTSYFLVRSSPKWNERLLRSKLFGPILTDWQQRGGIRRDVKVKAIVVVTAFVAVSILVLDPAPTVVWSICTLVTIGVLVIWRIPSI